MRKVICALSDGTIAVFKRGPDGQWDLTRYYSIRLGPKQYSVRCLTSVHSKVWCGYKNRIHVFDPKTLTVQVRKQKYFYNMLESFNMASVAIT